MLAQLLDFSGGVALAELFRAPAPDGSSHPEASTLANKLQEKVHAELDGMTRRALAKLAAERAEIGPAQWLEVIERELGGAGRAPRGQAAVRVSRKLGAPLRAALAAGLRQAQVECSRLRHNIALNLRALGPRAERLEQLDAALQLSIQIKLGRLFERLTQAAEHSFERASLEACAALTDGFGAAEVARWAEPHGFIELHRERCERMLQALCGHLRRNIEGLLAAAVQLETAE
ncbi:MAG TPA: hypothetical protein VJR89_37275 [Polyangiales bacterium]|nr:hypothetical protein [Polyangiales bacterium]